MTVVARALTLVLCLALVLAIPGMASAEEWSSEGGGPGRNPVSAVHPGSPLAEIWRATDVSIPHEMNSSAPSACVLVDELRVYAVHRDPADDDTGRVVAVSRATGERDWRTAPFPLDRFHASCPVLSGGRVVVATSWRESPAAPPMLRTFDRATGAAGWSRQVSVQSSLASDGTRVVGTAYDETGCPTPSLVAWDLTDGDRLWCVAIDASSPPFSLISGGSVVVSDPGEQAVGVKAYALSDGALRWSDPWARAASGVAEGGQVAHAYQEGWPSAEFGVRLRDAATGEVVWDRRLPCCDDRPHSLLVQADRVYGQSALMNGGGNTGLRLRALARTDGSDAWTQPLDGSPTGQPFLLAGGLLSGLSTLVDAATGTLTDKLLTIPVRPDTAAYARGTIYGWSQNADQTYSLVAHGDANPPAITAVAPADGAWVTTATPELTFSVDDGTGSGLAKVEVLLDGVPHEVDGSSWTPAAPLTDGDHTWRVRATDVVGNVSRSPVQTLRVDPSAPSAFSVTAPGDVATSAYFKVSWEASADAHSGIARYDVLLDGEHLGTKSGDCSPTCSLVPGPTVPDGEHTIEVVAVNGAGLTRSSGIRALEVAVPPVASAFRDKWWAFTGREVVFDAGQSWDNDPGELTYEWAVGDAPFEAGGVTHALTFDEPGIYEIWLRVTGPNGRRGKTMTDLVVGHEPPDGDVGVVINGGDYATNDRDVTLSFVWRPLDTDMVVAHEDEFRGSLGAEHMTVTPTRSWRLQGSAVHVRYWGRPDAGAKEVSDTIVVDTADPEVVTATLVSGRTTVTDLAPRTTRTVRVRIAASDGKSGVRGYQVTGDRDVPGSVIKVRRAKSFKDTVRATISGSGVWVRVVDAAGNRSSWVRAR